jgi:hypothetical protein
MMAKRGISVDHATVGHWVVRYSPSFFEQSNRRKRSVSREWHVDEAYAGDGCISTARDRHGVQRFTNDLVGHVLSREEWEVISIVAIATETRSHQLSDDPDHVYVRGAGEVLHDAREPPEGWRICVRVQGSLLFAAQYRQNSCR